MHTKIYTGVCNICNEPVKFLYTKYDIEKLGSLGAVINKYALCEKHHEE